MPQALWDQREHPGIYIETTNNAFLAACRADLNRLFSRTVGKGLLDIISKRARGIGTKVGKHVLIQYTNDWQATAQNSLKIMQGQQQTEVRGQAKPGSVVRVAALGDSSVVEYGHDLDYSAELGLPSPPFVVLGHELIHALHVISGDVVKEYDWNTDGAIIEEARTVGLGPYAKTRFSENAIRDEWGLPRRTYYSTPGDTNGVVGVTS